MLKFFKYNNRWYADVPNHTLDENEMVAGAKMAGDTLVYRFDFSPQTGDLGYGAGWHPSKKQHQRMAEELITFLQANIL